MTSYPHQRCAEREGVRAGGQAGDAAEGEEDLRITAEDGIPLRLAEDPVAWGGRSGDLRRKQIAALLGPALDQRLGVLAAVVVDHQQLGIGQVVVERAAPAG